MTSVSTYEAAIPGTIHPDSRKSARFPMRSFLWVCRFELGGRNKAMRVEGLNLSPSGIAFVAAEPMAVGSRVHVELPCSRLTATAHVRNCEARGGRWRVGVELEATFASMS